MFCQGAPKKFLRVLSFMEGNVGGIALVAEFVVVGAINVCVLVIGGQALGIFDLKEAAEFFKQAPLVALFFVTGVGYLSGVISHTFSKRAFRCIDFSVHIEMLCRYWKAFNRDLLSEIIHTEECTELLKKQTLSRCDVKWNQREALFDMLRVMGHCVYALSTEASQATLRHRALVRLMRGTFAPLAILGILLLVCPQFNNNICELRLIPGCFVFVVSLLCLFGYKHRYKRFCQSRIMGFLVYQHRWLNKKPEK